MTTRSIAARLLLLPLLISHASSAQSPVPSAPLAPRPFAAVPLSNPRSLALDGAGNLYVIDVDTGKLAKITPAGMASVWESPGLLAIQSPIGLAADRDGAFVVADADHNAVYRLFSDGAPKSLGAPTDKAVFSEPTAVALDSSGNVFVANNTGNTILKITSDGAVSVFAGKPGEAGSADGAGADARFGTPLGIAIDSGGNLYVADRTNANIRKITPAGVVSTLAGEAGKTGRTDGDGTAAHFNGPRAIAVDSVGTVYVADTDNHCVRKVTPEGAVSTLAGKLGEAGAADGAGSAARFNAPRGIAVDAAGNVFVADGGNGAVRQVTPDGTVTTIAAAKPLVASVPRTGPAPLIPPRTGVTERFDYSHARTFDGWDGDPTYWTIKDGAFTAKGEKVQSQFLLTQKNFSDFRMTFSTRVIESDNHAGVCLWGDRVSNFYGKNRWAYKGPLLMFPGLGIWDYNTNTNIPVDPASKALARKIAGPNDWIHIEMLAQGNRLRVAYNGQQVLDWRELNPDRLKVGPIGLQLHGFTKHQEVVYKDVVIETFPKEDRLLTVKE